VGFPARDFPQEVAEEMGYSHPSLVPAGWRELHQTESARRRSAYLQDWCQRGDIDACQVLEDADAVRRMQEEIDARGVGYYLWESTPSDLDELVDTFLRGAAQVRDVTAGLVEGALAIPTGVAIGGSRSTLEAIDPLASAVGGIGDWLAGSGKWLIGGAVAIGLTVAVVAIARSRSRGRR
jgi:hypothetical protein